MKENARFALRAAGFVLLTAMVLTYAVYVLTPKHDYGVCSMANLYDQPENSIDVLAVGTSLVYAGVNTNVLWAEHGIAAICAHTNLDAAQGGVNDALAQAVGLIDPVPLEVDGTDENGLPYGIGLVGELSGGPMSVQAFAQRAKDGLRLGGIRAMDAGVPVQKVAVGGGACGSMLAEARAMGCDTFLTADLKHDIYLEAKALGINLLDAGHYSTETVVCPVVAGWLEAAFPELQVTVSQRQGEVFQYF